MKKGYKAQAEPNDRDTLIKVLKSGKEFLLNDIEREMLQKAIENKDYYTITRIMEKCPVGKTKNKWILIPNYQAFIEPMAAFIKHWLQSNLRF